MISLGFVRGSKPIDYCLAMRAFALNGSTVCTRVLPWSDSLGLEYRSSSSTFNFPRS